MRTVYRVTSLMATVEQAMADARASGATWLRTTHIRLAEERRSLLVADTDPSTPVPRRSDGWH